MEILLARLASMLAAAGLMFGSPSSTHTVDHVRRATGARPARCASAQRRARAAHACRAAARTHATTKLKRGVRHKAGKHAAPPRAKSTPAPTTAADTAPSTSAGAAPAPSAPPVTPTPLPALPASTSPPSIAGTPTVGSTLEASLGSWANRPTSYTYHWSECPGACTGSNGSQLAGTSDQPAYVPQARDVGDVIYLVVTAENAAGQATAYSTPTVAITSGGDGAGLVYDGTFGASEPNYPDIYGNCASTLAGDQLQFTVTSACNPAGDGHYRTDFATPDVFPAGVPECTSVPFDMVNLPTVPNDSWFGFAEAKDAAANLAGWGFGVTSYYGGVNQLEVEFNGYNNTAPAWTSTGGVPSGWNTLSICTNDANDSSGAVYGIWLNGIRQTFNHGPATGSQTLSGFAIIDDGAASWPLDINDYTGGSPVENQIIHGAPLVASMGADGLPPEPTGGWNAP